MENKNFVDAAADFVIDLAGWAIVVGCVWLFWLVSKGYQWETF